MAVRTANSWDGTAGPRRFARATRPAGQAQPSGDEGGRPSPSRSPRPPQPPQVPGRMVAQQPAAGGVSMHSAGKGLRGAQGLAANSCCCCCR